MKENDKQNLPTRFQSLIFRGKAAVFQTKRGAENLLDPNLKRFSQMSELIEKQIIAESKTLLWTEKEPQEQFLLAGKIHNLRLAVKKLDGLEIPANHVFSFWKHIGKTTRLKGYVAGRELREGCIIPNIGGGLCQISNALYDAALKANFEIIERHAHTQIVRGSLAEQGRDATVFWNYVDLRFKSPNAFRIEAKLDAKTLTIRFKSESLTKKDVVVIAERLDVNKKNQPNSCATCGVNDCFRSIKPQIETNFGRTAYLLDEFYPEFDDYIQGKITSKDLLLIPLDGKRFKKANYAWKTNGFLKTRQSFLVTALRSYNSRKLAAQGASRQLNLLAMYEKLAKSYAKNLSYDVLNLVIQQNLLPFLWKSGALGGRTFDVLMTALPMKSLQEKLDYAKSLHSESKTLGDFRADTELLKAEIEALKNARKIITPHTEIAAFFSGKSELLNWNIPKVSEKSATENIKPVVYFPASTVGRKGVYELREALRGLDVKLRVQGAIIEAEDFWKDLDVERGNVDSLNSADLVVLPAFVEHKPRLLLRAAAMRIPVIASKACGVENVEGIETIESADATELREKILRILFEKEMPQKNITHVAKSAEMFSK
jgi:glycosyltransferase involved in cell wall biosynthesis